MKRRIALILVLALMVPAYIWAWTAGGGSGTYSPTLNGNITISGGSLTVTGGDIFLDTGRKIDFGAGNTTLTHATGQLTLGGGDLYITNLNGNPGAVVLQQASGKLAIDNSIAYDGTNLNLTASGAKIAIGPSGAIQIYAEAAEIAQLGTDAASPAAQTFKGPDGSGADAPGAKLTLAGGRPTGTGRPAPTCIAAATTSAVSSSTQQTLIERFCVDEKGISLPPVSFANLGNTNGYLAYCTDCDAPTLVDSTCTSSAGKVGSLAIRVNGLWKCIS